MKMVRIFAVPVFVLLVLFITTDQASSVGVVPWFQISDTPALQSLPEVAHNAKANQYLVIWEDFRGDVGFGSDIYAQRLSSTGERIGGNFPITTANDWQRSPRVEYSSGANRYLVVWDDHVNHNIHGQMVAANGTLFGSTFPIAVAPEYQWNPDLAYNPRNNQFLVVWQDGRSGNDKDIFGQFVKSDGSLNGANFPISDRTTSQSELLPAIAYNSDANQYLVVWEDYRNPATDADIYARVVKADGSFNGADFPISTASADQEYPDIAYATSKNRYLVVWEQSSEIYGRLINANKTPAGADFRIGTSSGGLSEAAVSYDSMSDKFMVVWRDFLGSDDINARLVNVDGSMPEPVIALATQGQGDLEEPAITTNTTDHIFMIVWQHETCHNEFDNCNDNDNDIFGAFFGVPAQPDAFLPVLYRVR